MKLPLYKKLLLIDRISYLAGLVMGWLLWSIATMGAASADGGTAVPPPVALFATTSVAMFIATFIGSIGSYLSFGEDKKFPPSAASIGHIMLGFGAGLFFTRGSLELMGRMDSTENVVLSVSFLWAVAGYFILRLVISVANSDQIKAILPDWVARILGVEK